MAGGFLYKPFSQGDINAGGLSVLLNGTNSSSASIIGPDGNVVTNLNRAQGTPEAGQVPGVKYYSRNPGASYGNGFSIRVNYNDGSTENYPIPVGGQRYEGDIGNPGSLRAVNKGVGEGGGGAAGGGAAFAPGAIGFGATPAYIGQLFPSPVTSDYQNIAPASYNFTDVGKFAQQFGDINRNEFAQNRNQAKGIAGDELSTELQGLQGFVPGAADLSRSQTAIDNPFNLGQRSQAVDAALPTARTDLAAQATRAQRYAQGLYTNDIEDKAAQITNGSAAADLASAGGFGASSSASRSVSALASAADRMKIAQYGEGLISSNLTQQEQLLLPPTEYANTGSQVKVTPSIPGSQLEANAESQLNDLTTVSPTNALQSTVQQQQFVTNENQDTNKFNASNNLQNSQFNATSSNNFALTKFQYQAGFAGALAGASQTNINTGVALQQQAQAQQIYQDFLNQAQNAQQTQAIAQGIATLLGAGGLSGIAGGAASLINSLTGSTTPPAQVIGGSTTDTTGAAGVTAGASALGGTSVPAAPVTNASGGGSTALSGGGTSAPYDPSVQGFSSGYAYGGSTSSVIVPNGSPIPVGFVGTASVPAPDGSQTIIAEPSVDSAAGSFTSFQDNTGLNLLSADIPTKQAAIAQSGAMLKAAGIQSNQTKDSIPVGVDPSGKQIFANSTLLKSADTTAGSNVTQGLGTILSPLVSLTPQDSGKLNSIAQAASSVSLAADLTDRVQRGDIKGFVSTVLGAVKQPVANAVSKDPQNRAGMSAAFSAAQLAGNWDRMSPAQKSLAIASLGIQGYKFADGTDLATKPIIKPGATGDPGLTVGQALNLASAGYNVYSLTKNWNQLNTIQKLSYGAGTAAQVAQTAQSFGMLGAGAGGAEVANVTAQGLANAGWSQASQYGIGAVSAQVGSKVPAGYSVVSNTGGVQIAAPTGTAESASGAVGTLGAVAGGAGAILATKQIYDGWGQGGKTGVINGALGGSALAASMYTLGATNPYVLAGVVAVSVLGDGIKLNTREQKISQGAAGLAAALPTAGASLILTGQALSSGKSDQQVGRDAVRGRFQQVGLTDKDNNVTLADGSKVNLGIDGHGGQHSVTNPGQLISADKGRAGTNKLNAWDTDYTNDLDYVASMGGIAFARITAGGKATNVDQLGGQLGNAALGNVGYGKQMTPDNFGKVMGNLRAQYAKAGIKSKADAYQLVNQAYAEHRLDEGDTIAAQQAFNMMYDPNGIDTAQKLMGGRNHGLEVAANSAPATIHAPLVANLKSTASKTPTPAQNLKVATMPMVTKAQAQAKNKAKFAYGDSVAA